MEQLHIDESLSKKDIIGMVIFMGLILISPAIIRFLLVNGIK